jgi:prefoldin subunit 5
VALAACNGALPSPSRDAAQGQNMLDLADALNQIREQSAGLQEQVDSLRGVVLSQDSVIRQLAATAGIAIKPPQ